MLFSRQPEPRLAPLTVPSPAEVPGEARPYYLPLDWAGPSPEELLDRLESKDSLHALAAQQFDEVIAALFRRQGATRVKVLASTDGDAGIDIRMLFEEVHCGLQCLHVPTKHQTTLKTVERFAANLRSTPARVGYYLSTGQLPYEAKAKLATAPIPVYLMDGASIWTLIVNSRANS